MFRCTARFDHISSVKFGQKITGLGEASTVVVSRFGARPFALCPRTSAEAGKTRNISHQRASSMWPGRFCTESPSRNTPSQSKATVEGGSRSAALGRHDNPDFPGQRGLQVSQVRWQAQDCYGSGDTYEQPVDRLRLGIH